MSEAEQKEDDELSAKIEEAALEYIKARRNRQNAEQAEGRALENLEAWIDRKYGH